MQEVETKLRRGPETLRRARGLPAELGEPFRKLATGRHASVSAGKYGIVSNVQNAYRVHKSTPGTVHQLRNAQPGGPE